MLFILSSFRSCGRGLTRICLIWENDGGSGWDGAKKGRESIPQTHVCTVEGGRGRGHVFMWVSKARWLSFRNAGIARSATALNRAHFVDDLSFALLSLSLSLSLSTRARLPSCVAAATATAGYVCVFVASFREEAGAECEAKRDYIDALTLALAHKWTRTSLNIWQRFSFFPLPLSHQRTQPPRRGVDASLTSCRNSSG